MDRHALPSHSQGTVAFNIFPCDINYNITLLVVLIFLLLWGFINETNECQWNFFLDYYLLLLLLLLFDKQRITVYVRMENGICRPLHSGWKISTTPTYDTG